MDIVGLEDVELGVERQGFAPVAACLVELAGGVVRVR